jgi:hypothetical protein
MDLRETVCEGLDLIQLARNTIHWRGPVNIVTNLRVP